MVRTVCRGCWHPATGSYVELGSRSKPALVCGPCERRFLRWVSGFTDTKGRRSKETGKRYSFYEYAAKKP